MLAFFRAEVEFFITTPPKLDANGRNRALIRLTMQGHADSRDVLALCDEMVDSAGKSPCIPFLKGHCFNEWCVFKHDESCREVCKFWTMNGVCHRGQKCTYAHSESCRNNRVGDEKNDFAENVTC